MLKAYTHTSLERDSLSLIVSLFFPPLCRHLGFSSDLYLNQYNYLLNIKHSSRLASEGACSVTTRLF